MAPDPFEPLIRQAGEYQRAGRLAEAERTYRHVLARQPQHPHALNGLGALALIVNRPAEAASLFARASAAAPHDLGFSMNWGTALLRQAHFAEAAEVFRHVVALAPGFPEAHNNLGAALAQLNDPPGATAAYREALRLRPNYAGAWANLANSLRDQGRTDEAIEAYRAALAIDPRRPDVLTDWGVALGRAGRHDEARALHQQALAIDPRHPAALNNLGAAAERAGDYDQAIALHRQALSADPTSPAVLNNLGVCLTSLKRYDEADACFQRGIHSGAGDASVHVNRSSVLLVRGKWKEGLKEYEYRPGVAEAARRARGKPRWEGSDPTGLTVALCAEQGVGDVLQFIRYAPLLASRGAKVVAEVQADLVELIRRVPGVSRVVERGQSLEPFDCYVPLLSLPLLCGTTPDTIPAPVPYLLADPIRVVWWRERLNDFGPGPRVGLVWAGNPEHLNDANRSCRLTDFAPLASLPGICWLSLQKGPAAGQIVSCPPGLNLTDLGP